VFVYLKEETDMAFENTIIEQDMDANAQNFVQGFKGDMGDYEPDLSVDGLSESMLSRVLSLFSSRRS